MGRITVRLTAVSDVLASLYDAEARLLHQIARQDEEGGPDHAQLAQMLDKVRRDILALSRLFDRHQFESAC